MPSFNSALKYCSLVLLSLTLAACSTSRYSMKHDAAPVGDFDASQVPDAIPKWEPLSRGGNKSPYTVRGKRYHVLPSAEGYEEEGISSWYGLKFHGELTSNGEVYNMYEMTAAHKTLPLPSYVKVTNLENLRSAIVRVNDRGPFHSERVIDLSYAAAIKLGFQKQGTAKVKLEAITLPSPAAKNAVDGTATAKPDADRLAQYVQIVAFSSEVSANKAQANLKAKLDAKGQDSSKLFVAKSPYRNPPIYRVRMGPYHDDKAAKQALESVKETGSSALLITRSVQGSHY